MPTTRRIYTFTFLFVSFLFHQEGIGQGQFGLSQTNYSPATTVRHNPSSIVDSEVMADIYVTGFGAFLHTNYAYLDAKEFSSVRDVLIKRSLPDAHVNESRDRYSAYSNADYQFLSGTFQYKHHGFAFTSRLRTFVDVRNVPGLFATGLSLPNVNSVEPTLNLNLIGRDVVAENFDLTLLSYMEIGFSYANAIYHRDRDLVILGASSKYLHGIAGGGLHIDSFRFRFDSTGVLSYDDLTAQATTVDGVLGGRGYAADIGITYKRMLDNVTNYNPFRREAGCRVYNYKWKVGAAFTDVGYMFFNKNSRKSTVENASGIIEDYQNFGLSADPQDFLESSLGVPDSLIKRGESFTIITPAAFVFQYDYNFEKNHMFISVQFMQGLTPKSTFGVQRPQLVTFAPRYESRYFEVGLPFGMYNRQEVRSGFYVRVGPVTLGTDKLGSVLSLTDVTGFDIYGSLSFKILQEKKCGKRRVW